MADNLFFSRDTKIFLGISKIKDLHVTTAGSGYTVAPAITISGGGGTGATATCTISGGAVNSVTITNQGSGYTSIPTVTVGNIYANSTAFAVGDQVNAAGILYTVTSAGTTDSDGNGPTHTTGSADDGTVTFAHAGVATVLTGGAGVWEIPVLDGFSLSQGTNTSEITLNEASDASGNSKRGRQMFTDSYAPAEWSFTTYARPFKASGTVAGGGANQVGTRHHAVEEALWANMVADGTYISPVQGVQNQIWKNGITNSGPATGTVKIDFNDSNKVELGTFELYYSLGEASTEVKTTSFPSFSGADIITSSTGTLASGQKYVITSVGNTTWSNFASGATGTLGEQITITSAGTITGSGQAVPLVGSANARLWIPNIAGISVGDKVTFTGTGAPGATTVSALTPNSPATYLGVPGIQLADARSVPQGVTATFTNRVHYKIADCVVNEASIDFDIDGIASINWSGLGQLISETTMPVATVYEGTTSTSNFIRNRLTALTITAADNTTYPGASSDGVYNTVLTGGNITISNNITYLTPESTGQVNQPLGHVTGTRTIGGSFTCYLNKETGSSADLFEDLQEATNVVTNNFDLKFSIGGVTSTPRLDVQMATCHLEIPTHSLDDVISVEANFHALPSTINGTDEAILTYTGA